MNIKPSLSKRSTQTVIHESLWAIRHRYPQRLEMAPHLYSSCTGPEMLQGWCCQPNHKDGGGMMEKVDPSLGFFQTEMDQPLPSSLLLFSWSPQKFTCLKVKKAKPNEFVKVRIPTGTLRIHFHTWLYRPSYCDSSMGLTLWDGHIPWWDRMCNTKLTNCVRKDCWDGLIRWLQKP